MSRNYGRNVAALRQVRRRRNDGQIGLGVLACAAYKWHLQSTLTNPGQKVREWKDAFVQIPPCSVSEIAAIVPRVRSFLFIPKEDISRVEIVSMTMLEEQCRAEESDFHSERQSVESYV